MNKNQKPTNTVSELGSEVFNSDVVKSDVPNMTFSTVHRKVINPTIVTDRITKRESNNVWDYVEIINKQLTTLPILENGSIKIVFEFAITAYIHDQIIEIYELEGWSVTTNILSTPQNGFPGKSELIFQS